MNQEPEIYCPHCKYRPRLDDRWECMPSCGTVWHTFWTGGVCPGCQYHWEKTQCPACNKLSPHKAWYHYPAGSKHQEHETDKELVST